MFSKALSTFNQHFSDETPENSMQNHTTKLDDIYIIMTTLGQFTTQTKTFLAATLYVPLFVIFLFTVCLNTVQ